MLSIKNEKPAYSPLLVRGFFLQHKKSPAEAGPIKKHILEIIGRWWSSEKQKMNNDIEIPIPQDRSICTSLYLSRSLYIEPEVHNVTVLHNVFFSFNT